MQPFPVVEGATDAGTLLSAGAALGAARVNPGADGAPYAVVPPGFTVAPLPTISMPARPVALAKLRDASSFIAYVNDHKVARSRIYAALEPAKFLAVFDDFGLTRLGARTDATTVNHSEPATVVISTEQAVREQADWRQFRAQFEVPASREWKVWTAANRKDMSQLGFAEFLQDNLPDVVRPDGASLLEMALNFEAATGGQFIATQRLQDGSHNLQWKADNNAAGTVKLPPSIELAIPVFENEQRASVTARLLYRVKDGNLSLRYELVRPHVVLEAAFRTTWQRIANDTSVPVLLGSPE